MNRALTDDHYARGAERFYGLQPRVDDDEQTTVLFAQLSPPHQVAAVAEYAKKFGTALLLDALSDLDVAALIAAYEAGDGATGALVRRCITTSIGPAIDRAVGEGRFEL